MSPRAVPAVQALSSSNNNQAAASSGQKRQQRNDLDAVNLHLHSAVQPVDIEGPSDIGKHIQSAPSNLTQKYVEYL